MRLGPWSSRKVLVAILLFLTSPAVFAAEEKPPTKQLQKPTVKLATEAGEIVLELWPDVAPGHVVNLMSLVKKRFYDGLAFHRVAPGFVIQGGCPKGDGSGNPGYSIKAEFSETPHERGVLSMARAGDVDSGGSQFFICLDRERCRELDRQYTVFGKVVSGMEVVDKIAAGALVKDTERPIKPLKIRKATIVAEGEHVEPKAPLIFAKGTVRTVAAKAPTTQPTQSDPATRPSSTSPSVDDGRSTPVVKTAADDAFFKSMKGILETTPEQAIAADLGRANAFHREVDSARVKQNLIDADKFLAENKKATGVLTTGSGLQYKILRDGDGSRPRPGSFVRVHYLGTLIDGTKFDSSYDRKIPAAIPVQLLCKGLAEGLQLMKVGSQCTFWIHPSLGYGEQGAGGIAGNELMIFEVDLLEIINN